MNINSYRDLVVWQKAMRLVKVVYPLAQKLPKGETYALSDQMRRAAVSISSNIAEGYKRNSTKEYIKFLSIARESKVELQTQLIICVEMGYLMYRDIKTALEILDEINKMLTTMIKTLTSKP